MNDMFRRILASSLCVQLTFLGMTLEGCAARQVSTTPGPSEFLAGTQPTEPRLRQVLQEPYVELFRFGPNS